MPAKEFGRPVPGFVPPPRPAGATLAGRFVRPERLNPGAHGAELFAANSTDDAIWDYLPYGPFGAVTDYLDWLNRVAGAEDPVFYAPRDMRSGHAAGVASYLRISPEAGCIEVGHITLSPLLQRAPAATEAMFLMMQWAFGAGYRRYEWKCDALNAPSRRAAERLGFSFEGVFRQAAIVKGRNRDTAWYSVIDREWPALSAAFSRWLAQDNFDAGGLQFRPLAAFRA